MISIIVVFIIYILFTNLWKFQQLPFYITFKPQNYNKTIFNISDVLFKLAQWSLFVAAVSVAAQKTDSVTLTIMSVILRIILFFAVCSVVWSLMTVIIVIKEEKSVLNKHVWKFLLFLLVWWPIYDVYRFFRQAVVDATRNISI